MNAVEENSRFILRIISKQTNAPRGEVLSYYSRWGISLPLEFEGLSDPSTGIAADSFRRVCWSIGSFGYRPTCMPTSVFIVLVWRQIMRYYLRKYYRYCSVFLFRNVNLSCYIITERSVEDKVEREMPSVSIRTRCEGRDNSSAVTRRM